jgi:hypothetical protein
MKNDTFTIIDDGRVETTHATIVGERVCLTPAALQAALGWEVKPQGLCKGDRCIPVLGQGDVATDAGVDLAGFAALLSRPLAVDLEERAACLGASAAERSASLASLEAPDFTLPDLDGTLHALSDYRGKKVLLVAYASW